MAERRLADDRNFFRPGHLIDAITMPITVVDMSSWL